MSSQDKLLAQVERVLARAADDAPKTEPSRDARARTVAAMQEALRARAANKRRRTWAMRAAIAASVILGALGAQRLYSGRAHPQAEVVATARGLGGAATAFRDGKPVALEGGQLASGDRIVTGAGGRAEIGLSTGTNVTIGPSAEVTFAREDKTQRFELAAGSVQAHVAKLKPGERFLVHTKDAEVEVRGTVFEVSLVAADPSCGGGTPTRVHVSEGVVVVRNQGSEARVAAGETWPRCTPVVTPEQPAANVVAPSVVATATAPTPTAKKAAPVASAAPIASVSAAPPAEDALAAKNDLFASALSAKRKGQLHTALAGFDAYLSQYPNGELVESAMAQRMNILAKLDAARAAKAAADYLARYPNGFAKGEAQALIDASP